MLHTLRRSIRSARRACWPNRVCGHIIAHGCGPVGGVQPGGLRAVEGADGVGETSRPAAWPSPGDTSTRGGQQAGTPPAWPNDNSFLGKPRNPNSGLDVLGARDYDPATGSFLSLDPQLEEGSPQQMGGYAYAADNPATKSDPSGQDPIASAIVSYLRHTRRQRTTVP